MPPNGQNDQDTISGNARRWDPPEVDEGGILADDGNYL